MGSTSGFSIEFRHGLVDTDIGDNLWSRNTAHNVLKAALRKGEEVTLRVMRRGSHNQIVSVLKPEPMCQSFVYLI